jgi:hypothetical protein
VVEADIKGYFDAIDHTWLMKFLEHDIQDKNFLRYVVRFLKAGIFEDGSWRKSEQGSPQGGLVSPVLANVYLHYVLDLWFEKVVKPRMRGEAYLFRYADDFLGLFQHEDDARKFYKTLPKRLAKFNLEVAEDKTRNGNYAIVHRTSKKKLKMKQQTVKQWLRWNMHRPVREIFRGLNRRLVGHYRYYGISGNSKGIGKFYYYCVRTLFKTLRRRGQKHRINWDIFKRMIHDIGLAPPRICVNIWY